MTQKENFIRLCLDLGIISVNPEPADVPFIINGKKLWANEEAKEIAAKMLKTIFDEILPQPKIVAGVDHEGGFVSSILAPEVPYLIMTTSREFHPETTYLNGNEVLLIFGSVKETNLWKKIEGMVNIIGGKATYGMCFIDHTKSDHIFPLVDYSDIVKYLDQHVDFRLDIGIPKDTLWKLKEFQLNEKWPGGLVLERKPARKTNEFKPQNTTG